MENGLKYALATGNWGTTSDMMRDANPAGDVKKAHESRAGVSQVNITGWRFYSASRFGHLTLCRS